MFWDRWGTIPIFRFYFSSASKACKSQSHWKVKPFHCVKPDTISKSHSNIKIRYIRDERTYEPRYNVNPGGKQLKVYLIKNTNYIKLGHKNSIHHDGDPYHNIKNPNHFQTLHLKHEEHCPDGFICTSGKWYWLSL